MNGLQVIYLARHGEPAWSLSGQHTGLTDLPLTTRGECNARRLGERLNGLAFARVFTSPLQRAKRPDWEQFRDGFPGGESFAEIGARADRVVGRVRGVGGAGLLFSSGHFLRVLAARWLGLETQGARYFLLGTASLSTLTYEHNPSEPAIGLWNDTRHLSA